MATFIEEFGDLFISKVLLGMYILPSDRNSLGAFRPDLSKMDREDGILMQREIVDGKVRFDGGDSAHKTGCAAFCNSDMDQALLPQFELLPAMPGIMVRHPTQAPKWTNWRNVTRDQMLAFVGGCWRAGRNDIAGRLLSESGKRGWTCQDTEYDEPGTTKNPPIGDLLGPHDQMFLRACAGENTRYDLLGHLALQIMIETSDPSPDEEKNQIMLQSIVCGRLDLYVKTHPSFRDDITTYWGGWRGQAELGRALITVVELELKRYKGQIEPFLLLPVATINELRNEIKNGRILDLYRLDPVAKVALLERFAKAMLSDIQVQAEQMLRRAVEEMRLAAEATAAVMQAAAELLATAVRESERIMEEVVKAAETGAKLVEPKFIGAIIASVLLGIDLSHRDGSELEWEREVASKLNLIIHNTEEIIKDLSRLRMDVKEIVAGEFRTHYIRSVHAFIAQIGVRSAGATATRLSEQQETEIRRLIDELSVLLYTSLGYGFQVIPHALVAYSAILAAQRMIGTSRAEIIKFKETAIDMVFFPAIQEGDTTSLNFFGQLQASNKRLEELQQKLYEGLSPRTVMIFSRDDPNRPGFLLDGTLMKIGQGYLLNQVTVDFIGRVDVPESISSTEMVINKTNVDFAKAVNSKLEPPRIIDPLPIQFGDARQAVNTRLTELQELSRQFVAEQIINSDLKSLVAELKKIIDIEKASILNTALQMAA